MEHTTVPSQCLADVDQWEANMEYKLADGMSGSFSIPDKMM